MSTPGGHTPNEQHYHKEMGKAQRKLSVRTVPELKRGSSRAELAAIGWLDALRLDHRPTFAIDESSPAPRHGALELVYCNPTLEEAKELLAAIRGRHSSAVLFNNLQLHSGFKKWLRGVVDEQDLARRGNAYMYEGYLWSVTVVDHYKVVSGVQVFTRSDSFSGRARPSLSIDPREHKEPKNMPQMVQDKLPSIPSDTPIDTQQPWMPSVSTKYGPFDYTLDPPPANMSAHLKYFRSIDWSQTPLGPMHSWSPQLRCLVNIVLNDSCPALLLWGDEVVMIYSEAYIEMISLMHPCMGQSARVAAKDYWPLFQPLADHINATGQTLSEHDIPIFVDRHGFLEETFWSFHFVPILNNDGHVAGFYQPLFETTKNKLLERRVYSLVELGSQTAKARDLQAYWDLVLNTLALNDKDAPFALLYAAETPGGPDISSVSSPGSASDLEHCVLKGSIGVQADQPIAPSTINMKEGSYVFHQFLLKAAKSRKPTVVHFEDLDLPEGMLSGINWKGYGDPCRCVVVCPILPTTSEQLQGFLILGVNPRRPFDEDYRQFVHVMLRLLATSLASVVLFDEEIRQKENAIGQAARIQEQLLAELQLKEKKFQRFAERSDVAIFILDASGYYTYRNQRWFDIFETAVDYTDVMGAWTRLVFPEDLSYCESLFTRLFNEKLPICFELKTNMPWIPPETSEPDCKSQGHFKWILCSAYPDVGPDNELIEVVGNVTDISRQKWAEDLQKMRTDSALESKQHLEHFIDTTSHEMRNPLSAIMQCADGILSLYCVSDGDCQVPSPISYSSLLEQTLDAAQTIAQCAQHMKRIVDDVLTISKLDSGLLVITPIDAQPENVVSHAVKMFEAEAKAAGVDLIFEVAQSYRDLDVNWVSVDPTRLLQVLINLITNAVKFTRLQPIRHITVSIAANLSEPPSVPGGVEFMNTKLVDEDCNLKDDWKQGSTLYLQFSVTDTGRGLSESEKSTLFARFSQASPRTHIHYGGSGLGLFISRRLTEMQGGAIGLASEYKKGSTFSFYIKVRRTTGNSPRKGSLPGVFPEDIRHRPSTPKEIDGLLNPLRPALFRRATSTFATSSPPSPTYTESITLKPRRSSMLRRQSIVHSDLPPGALDSPPEQGPQGFEGSNSISETLHVLIVEDNLVNQKVLAKQLVNLGCVIHVANHGLEALQFLKRTRYWRDASLGLHHLIKTPSHHIPSTEPPPSTAFDPSSPPAIKDNVAIDLSLILLDWEMPIMNGLTCVAKIRELEHDGWLIGRVPIIGVTANVRQQQIQTAMDAGMDDVVGKPFRVQELVGRMRSVIQMVEEAERQKWMEESKDGER